jgi:DegV family protein with EDD domain
MSATCILTDSSVQFPNSSSLNFEHLVVLPHHLVIDGVAKDDTRDAHTLNKMVVECAPSKVILEAPSSDDFRQALSVLSQKYQSIIIILQSSHLGPAYHNASQAIYQLKGPASIQVIDSQTIGAGLGMLVQVAIDAVQRGDAALQINRLVRGMVSHIYTVFCLQSLQSLAHSGHLDPAQAAVGEMLGVIPLYVLDSGKLVPIQKARSSRQLVDVLHEFVAEFNHIQHIALLQGIPPFEQEMRNLHDRLTQDFPVTLISEHIFGASIMALLGPRSIGVAVMEHNGQE